MNNNKQSLEATLKNHSETHCVQMKKLKIALWIFFAFFSSADAFSQSEPFGESTTIFLVKIENKTQLVLELELPGDEIEFIDPAVLDIKESLILIREGKK